jgi:hypothetical protein
MLITYRRTGGLFALLTLAAVAAAATVLTVAVAAIVLTVAFAIASAALLGRAVLPRSWRNCTVPTAALWPHETIDTTAVTAIVSSDTPNLPRMDDGTR